MPVMSATLLIILRERTVLYTHGIAQGRVAATPLRRSAPGQETPKNALVIKAAILSDLHLPGKKTPGAPTPPNLPCACFFLSCSAAVPVRVCGHFHEHGCPSSSCLW